MSSSGPIAAPLDLPAAAAPARLSHPAYRPDIDGLRALAVLAVVTYHAFPGLLGGGFVGVDVFFVISGFLIGTILYGSLARGAFSFTEFYVRRIRRIFPALLVTLLACAAFGWFALLAVEYRQLGKHIAAGAAFLANVALWRESGYFDNAVETKPLMHLWSLGVEEQFYILFPPLLWFAAKRRWNLAKLTFAVGVASFGLNLAEVRRDAVAAFYLPHTRFWELLAGACLAYLRVHGRTFWAGEKFRWGRFLAQYSAPGTTPEAALRDAYAMGGAALVAASCVLVRSGGQFPGFWAVPPVLGAVLLIAAGPHAWLNRVLLARRPLVWLGLISFPLYLWHWPLLAFARILESGTPGAGLRLAAVLLAVLLAWATYRVVERPLRFGARRRAIVLGLLGAMLAAASAGAVLYAGGGLPSRNRALEQNLAQAEYEKSFYANDIGRKAYPGYPGFYGYQSRAGAPTVMLLGDSHANRLIMGLAPYTGENLLQLSHHSCPEFQDLQTPEWPTWVDHCAAATDAALRVAENTPSIHTLVFQFRGAQHIGARIIRPVALRGRPEVKDPAQVFDAAVRATFDRLLAKGKRIVFVYDNPELPFDPQACSDVRPLRLGKRAVDEACTLPRADFERQQGAYRAMMARILADYPAVRVLDAAAALCDAQACYGKRDGKLLYYDNAHLSLAGSELVGRELAKAIAARPK